MRKYAQKEVTKKVTEQVEKTCDICEASFKGPLGYGDSWDTDTVHTAEVTIQLTTSLALPDGSGPWKRLAADVCPECFMSHIVPFLEGLGANIYEEEG